MRERRADDVFKKSKSKETYQARVNAVAEKAKLEERRGIRESKLKAKEDQEAIAALRKARREKEDAAQEASLRSVQRLQSEVRSRKQTDLFQQTRSSEYELQAFHTKVRHASANRDRQLEKHVHDVVAKYTHYLKPLDDIYLMKQEKIEATQKKFFDK